MKKLLFLILFLSFSNCNGIVEGFYEESNAGFNFQDFTKYVFSNLKEFNYQGGLYDEDNQVSVLDKTVGISQGTFSKTIKSVDLQNLSQNYNNNEKWMSDQTPETEFPNQNKTKDYVYPFVQKVTVNPNDKICVFGDIHGSIHSLLRNLLRLIALGYIDKDLKIKGDNFKIVFLGDLINRGSYSTEVLYLFLNLLKINPGNVHITRGNHEEYYMPTIFRLQHEIDLLYVNNPDKEDIVAKIRSILD